MRGGRRGGWVPPRQAYLLEQLTRFDGSPVNPLAGLLRLDAEIAALFRLDASKRRLPLPPPPPPPLPLPLPLPAKVRLRTDSVVALGLTASKHGFAFMLKCAKMTRVGSSLSALAIHGRQCSGQKCTRRSGSGSAALRPAVSCGAASVFQRTPDFSGSASVHRNAPRRSQWALCAG
jgi:hypothetical protein